MATITAATTVAAALTRTITARQPSAPMADRYHGTLNRGRNDGLPSARSSPAEMFSTPYVVRKNIVRIGAMTFRLPSPTASRAIASVTSVPALGVSSGPLPRPSQRSLSGSTPSRASAWSTRGAPSTEPTALDRVAPHTPSRIAGPHSAMRCMISGSRTRLSASARNARNTGRIM